MTAPALVKLGVPEGAAHMFIFYYAVLSEVSPPMALTPFAAAAITGGNPFKTTMLAWKYTLPAFIVPFMFCASPEGIGLLLKGPVLNIVLVTLTALGGVWALSGAVGGYLIGPLGRIERAALAVSGLLLFYAGTIHDLIGASILGLIVLLQVVRNRTRKGRGFTRWKRLKFIFFGFILPYIFVCGPGLLMVENWGDTFLACAVNGLEVFPASIQRHLLHRHPTHLSSEEIKPLSF